ncbi:prepilin-type N-terminal cleavage/methylation domain-containing protein [Pseudoalteromonas sp. MB41]|uniref:type IV pilus modification PilV family protein n=1 Tax=unclassified Pseudoalteromonas TaxID=194690 RepID=UPI0015D560CC|nr:MULTISPECIES: prepilin-type N-terminal cleavage/methylation domain-containing protein [unclassified Pseudoalteromonas]MCC9660806.1 prepilin-type N-terminal cleavage/methylation domain-containing protein [Pseudoalteromonas sp. MB41]QLJ07887.1 prepilin-type N-terminal cleavage/methylation domain-containing protein [Pseudoalteromonas sp. JSTW]
MIKQQGFSLLEVMISVVIAGIALLGLAAAQLKSLQYATNSFHYTVSLIQGQNSIERLWPHICDIQKTNPGLFQDATFRASLSPQVSDYELILPAVYNNDMQINVSWVDKRMTDNAENQISLNASFPDLSAVC